MHNYYGLEWIFEECSKKVTYMDNRIAIRKDRFIMALYEKTINLYLYTTPHSDQPLGLLTR